MLLICGMVVQSKNECTFHLEVYSDSDCTTLTSNARYAVEMNKCFSSHIGD